jgi:hypothetical protein
MTGRWMGRGNCRYFRLSTPFIVYKQMISNIYICTQILGTFWRLPKLSLFEMIHFSTTFSEDSTYFV